MDQVVAQALTTYKKLAKRHQRAEARATLTANSVALAAD
jgi:hypothetical protein